ncbi:MULTISPECIES: hypothetical protein [unclassified Sphingomonas]|uniref:hypothetical protein n=1 Tax=unclassified Sphingomonas TaxID=196159 RepID=UPI002150ADFD|nr:MULTISPECIES: hypothetical protein [unclassified Sphingomonas]MCR5870657.1 hypothetical protein [Sphingomonas sp. J344]UUY01005.1 hypothetical protein LRS08_08100 [Sphingomonas sp. J315]
MLIYRMEDEAGRGPFYGTAWPVLGWEEFRKFVAEITASSRAIAETLNDLRYGSASRRWERLERDFGRPPIFGAPDLECFERWFPLRYRRLYVAAGFRPVVYDVPAKAVEMGTSEAERMFIPVGPKRPLDPETLEPLESALSGAGADWQ